MTQTERLMRVLSDGKWHSNFALYRRIYGNAPCGRLSARIWDVDEVYPFARVVRATDKERGIRKPVRGRYWYKLAM